MISITGKNCMEGKPANEDRVEIPYLILPMKVFECAEPNAIFC